MSSLSDFLGEIGRHQLLTPERELTMGRKVQEMVVLVNRCQEAGGKGPACEYSEAERKKQNHSQIFALNYSIQLTIDQSISQKKVTQIIY